MLKFKTSCAVLAYLSSNLLNEVGLSLFWYFEVGLRVCDIVVKKFTFAISSPDEFLYLLLDTINNNKTVYSTDTELLVIVVVIIIIIIRSESYLSLLKSAVNIKHDRSLGSHYQMYFKFILRNTQRSRFFLPFCSTCPPSVATYAEQALSIRLWRWGWNKINGDLGQKWICLWRTVAAFRELLSALLSF